ncbi:efflux RND transporter periplasmic adaptor subunit [Balneolales bacterium ANBcel1]|nr:efflux RND transporter periplasmic adaptor subunit [Balneolales bacterium ANBcel1]
MQISIQKNLISLLTFVMLLVLAGCSGSDENGNNGWNNARPPTVEAVQVVTGSLPLEETLTGVVRARNQVDIYPEITAPVTEVLVNNGDYVEQGQVLVRLRDNEARERLRQAEAGHQIARAQVRQAEARLNRQRLELERVQQLHSRELETDAALQNLEAEVEAADATLELNIAQMNQAESVIDERQNELENTVIRAPVSGYVGLRNAEIGQQANPSTRLFQIGDPGQMKVELTLTEAMTGYIRSGHPATISSPGNGGVVDGTITRISPFLNPVTHTTTAEIEVDNPDRILRSGMFVSVNIRYAESERSVLVPNNAIYYHPDRGQNGIYVAERTGQELLFDGDEPPDELIGPASVQFVPIQIVARGRLITGVEGIPQDSWVVTLGQNLLVRGSEEAYVRPVSWDHIINLQEIQSRDLFDIIERKMASQASSDSAEA